MRRLAIGVDIGGTRTKMGLVDLEVGEVLKLLISPTEKKDPDKFLQMIAEGINQLKRIADKKPSYLLGAGFGVSGFVNEDGVVDSTYGFIEFMEDYPLTALIDKYCSLPCRADNDARIVALGEALYGKGKNYKRVLVLTLGTGLGVGFVTNGRFESCLPYAHMSGHMSIAHTDFTCYCGKRGCLESLVSATGMVEAAIRAGWKEKHSHLPLSVEAIFEAGQQGDADANAIVSNFLIHLRTGIDNYINLFAPDMIVLGGGISKGLKPYLEKLRQNNYLRPFKSYRTQKALSELDEQAGILGSAALFTN